MNRLHIDRLVSIGAVEDGDNPEADIVFWKRKAAPGSGSQQAPTAKAGGGNRASGSAPSPAALIARRFAKNQRDLDRIADAQSALRRSIEKEETMTPRKAEIAPAGTIRGQVDALALERVEKGASPNLTQARADVWKERPDLVEASRKEPGRVPGVYGGRQPAADTVPERIAEVVKARADEMSGVTQWWNLSDAERRVIVWKSPQGKKLRDAYTDAMKRGETKFTKSNDHPDAMRTLKAWEADPAQGLR